MLLVWLEFAALAALVVLAGSRLTFYADVIAEKSGMGRTWTGIILLASMTSLPELITGASSIIVANAPDLAVADVLGSCVFNLTIIALLDLLYRPGVILSRAEQGHILAAGFGLISLSLVAIGIFVSEALFDLGLLWIGIYTPLLFYLYQRGMRTIFRFENRTLQKERRQFAEIEQYGKVSRRRAYGGFAIQALLIVVSASILPSVAVELADKSGLSLTFVGVLLVALATSLPEVTTSIAAMRIGAIDLAVGGLLGSNMFNLNILAIDDLLYTKGPILAHVSNANLLPALAAILISAIAVLTLFYQPVASRFLRITWLGVVIAVIYALNLFGVYLLE